MHQERKDRILEKLAFDWPWDAEKARVQRTINSARKNYEAGGTLEQKQVNDNAPTIPGNITLLDRLRDWTGRQPGVAQPWSAGSRDPAPIFEAPADLGNPRANRALELLRQNTMTGFGPPGKGYTDCSTFACNVASAPDMTTDRIYQDARGKRKNWTEIPHQQMMPGDFLLYPSHVDQGGQRDYGHIAMYAGSGRVIDASASGSGVRYRQVPSAFYERALAGGPGSPIVVRRNGDNPYTGEAPPIPGAGTPVLFQKGQYTAKKFLPSLNPTSAATARR